MAVLRRPPNLLISKIGEALPKDRPWHRAPLTFQMLRDLGASMVSTEPTDAVLDLLAPLAVANAGQKAVRAAAEPAAEAAQPLMKRIGEHIRKVLPIDSPERAKNLRAFQEGSVAPDVFHGTASEKDFDIFDVLAQSEVKPEWKQMDTLLGPHVAKDPALANKFGEGLYGRGKNRTAEAGGRVMPLKADFKNPKIIAQPPYLHGQGILSDQTAIAQDIWREVGSDEDIFVPWAQRSRNWTPEEAKSAYDELMATGKLKRNGQEFVGTPGDFINDHDSAGFMLPEGMKLEVVDRYKKRLRDQGYDSIQYTNTAPMEVEGISDPISFIALDQRQLKSASGNRGTYDRLNPNITMGLAGAAGLGAAARSGYGSRAEERAKQ